MFILSFVSKKEIRKKSGFISKITTLSQQPIPMGLEFCRPNELPREGWICAHLPIAGEKKWHSKTFSKNFDLAEENQKGETLFWPTLKQQGIVFAFGVDKLYHPANAYLLDFTPFKIENFEAPLLWMSLTFHPSWDHTTFNSFYKDVWQTSKQSFRNLRGDCEDQAILLADWLQSSGFDARVVLGKFGREGHAWVVLFKNGQEFLLDSTNKHSRRVYPLAKYFPKYQPLYMFNHNTFWTNVLTASTTRYSGPHWKETAIFREGDSNS